MKAKKFKIFGLADHIAFGRSTRWRQSAADHFSQRGDAPVSFSNFYIFYLALFFVLLIFLARIFTLVVISGSENKALAEENRVRLVKIEAPRGRLFDRGGELLADSQKIYVLKKDREEQEISQDQATDLEKQGLAGENFEGNLGQILQKIKRVYFLHEAGAHLLGYVSVPTEEDLREDKNISRNQQVGKLGIEENYNDFLTGKAGEKLIEVDALEKKVSILGSVDPTRGRDLHLTVDRDLQKVTFEALQKGANSVGTKRGAAIISNPQTGEVLALVSFPSYDPEDIGKSVANLDKPFFNRAVQGVYPPGSIFKIITALSGLEEGKITEDTEFEDVGQFELGGAKFANWFFLKYGKVDGIVKLQRAIARSNDIYFYKAAEQIGLELIHKWSKKFGFGQKSGVDLPGEAVGLLPDEVWKKSTLGEDWFSGDTLHLGIGQGFILATPIQINVLTNYMASGKLTKPYIVSRIDGASGDTVNLGSKVLAQDIIRKENFDLVRAGMYDACKAGGTGAPFFNAPYDVGCKTGTAEKALGDPHAWFTTFAPFDKAQISVTVLVEDGGEGSVVAAPVAKQIVDWWMANRK